MRRPLSSGTEDWGPPRRIWPLIRERVGRGDLLSTGFTRNNVNRILKATLIRISFPEGGEFTSKAFRRGAAQELLQTGNTLEVIKGSGGWWGSGCRSYVDIEMDNAFRISRALIVLSDGSSSEEENRPNRTENAGNIGVASLATRRELLFPPKHVYLIRDSLEFFSGFKAHWVFSDSLLSY